jgi:hypothetical protein
MSDVLGRTEELGTNLSRFAIIRGPLMLAAPRCSRRPLKNTERQLSAI